MQQPLHCRPVQVGAGEAPIVITLGQRDPAFAPLTLNEGLGRFALRIK
jgi:hypothetical protein